MSEWTDRDDRQRVASAEYEHIMCTPAPAPVSAYLDGGVIGFVFGEMWRRGVLTPRDRRWITLACVGMADAPLPMETHCYAALRSNEVTKEEIDEFLLFFGTQAGWPKGSSMLEHILAAFAKIAEEDGETMTFAKLRPVGRSGRRRRSPGPWRGGIRGSARRRACTATHLISRRGRPRLPLRRDLEPR